MDPREHQRDVGEKEHYPRQEGQEAGHQGEEARARVKAGKNNKDRHEQTGHARAEAKAQKEGIGGRAAQ